MVETPDGDTSCGGAWRVQRGSPGDRPPGTPIDVALAVNLGPLPLEPGNRIIWRLSIDGEPRRTGRSASPRVPGSAQG